MKYQDEKFYWNYQHSVHWPADYIGPDLMTRWIIEKLVGFTDVGLYKISESVRAYVSHTKPDKNTSLYILYTCCIYFNTCF